MSLSKKLKPNVQIQTSNEQHAENEFMNDSLTLSHFFTHSNAEPACSAVLASNLQSYRNKRSSLNKLGTQKFTLSCFEKQANKVNDRKSITAYQDVINLETQFENPTVQEKFENHSLNHNAEKIVEISSTKLMKSHFENNYSYTHNKEFGCRGVAPYKDPKYHSVDNLSNTLNGVIDPQKYIPQPKIQNLRVQSTSHNIYWNNPNGYSGYQETKNTEIYHSLPAMFLNLIDELNYNLESLLLPPEVKCVYNSTVYARHTFEMYVRKYCSQRKPIMLFGMNPGPWGMSQTGVPFGEVNMVRDWLKIEGPVMKPPYELPMRPVLGFSCKRSEISGKRFWGLWKEICILPENFFRTSFVYNYLPQQWMTETGCNKTPSDFKADEMSALYDICDPIFCKVLELYQVNTIVAIGRFCETRAKRAIKRYTSNPETYKVIFIPHPSPRTANSNNWKEKMIGLLEETELLQYYKPNAEELVVPAVT